MLLLCYSFIFYYFAANVYLFINLRFCDRPLPMTTLKCNQFSTSVSFFSPQLDGRRAWPRQLPAYLLHFLSSNVPICTYAKTNCPFFYPTIKYKHYVQRGNMDKWETSLGETWGRQTSFLFWGWLIYVILMIALRAACSC